MDPKAWAYAQDVVTGEIIVVPVDHPSVSEGEAPWEPPAFFGLDDPEADRARTAKLGG